MPATITTSETQVNTSATGDQWGPTVTQLADGGWVVVWLGRVAIGSATNIFAQRYDADGVPIGGEVLVNSASADQWEGAPAVAALPDGGWIIVWHANSPHGGPSPASTLIYSQRYDSTGAAVGGEVQVNTPDGYIPGVFPEVVVLADGGWVIVWHAQNSATDADEDIYSQRYDSTGAPVGGEFQVNSSAANPQHFPSLAALQDGGWIVTWMSQGQDGSGWGVYAQRFNADGSAAGGETLITTTTAGNQQEPYVATLADGGWLIVWSSSGQDGSGHGIYAQRFDDTGARVGGEFRINTTTANDQLYATVDALPDGGWAVSWLSIVPGSDPYGGRIGNVYVQRYDAADNPVGGETLVGSGVEGDFSNLSTRVGALGDGGLVVTWAQYGTDGSGYGIYARTFDAPVNVINGTEGDDYLEGTSGDDHIYGFGGNDTIVALQGNDMLDGGDGHDFLVGRQGNDTLIGGNGNDIFRPGVGDDYVDGGAGFDRISHYDSGGATTGVTVSLLLQDVPQDTGHGIDTLVGIEALSGSPYDDTLIGDHNINWLIAGDGTDTLVGNGGDDLLEVLAGNHVVDGGADQDTVSFRGLGLTPGAVNVSLLLQGAAQDTGQGMMTLTNVENLSGTGFGDTLIGDSGANVLAGDIGNDTLVSGAGNDSLYGDGAMVAPFTPNGNAAPTFFSDFSTTDPALVGGNDTLEGGLGDDYLDGGSGIDTASYANASGGVNVNLATGSASGADGIDTLVRIENVIGSGFGDTLRGDNGNNVLQGGGGNDHLVGLGGDDTLDGGDGDDNLRGDGQVHTGGAFGNDTLRGGAGNDQLRGGPGVDSFDGGTDTGAEHSNGFGDRVSFYEPIATQAAVADLRTGVISNDGFGNVESMVGIESLGDGTAFADTFYGNDGRNYLLGSRGDFLYGFGGDDILQTASAPAVIDGGLGTDELRLSTTGLWLMPDADSDGIAEFAPDATSGWTVNLSTGTIVDGYGNTGTITRVENVTGSALDDSLTGNDFANVLRGNEGEDLLDGRSGDDSLYGGDGDDILVGGRGNDTLYGGRGDDVMVGYQGIDRFVVESESGDDRIIDFIPNIDKIVFDPSSGVTSSGQLTLTQVGNDTLITWGTPDSVLLQGVKPKQLSSADFHFGSPSAISSALASMTTNGVIIGAVAAAGLAAIPSDGAELAAAEGEPRSLTGGLLADGVAPAALDTLSSLPTDRATAEPGEPAAVHGVDAGPSGGVGDAAISAADGQPNGGGTPAPAELLEGTTPPLHGHVASHSALTAAGVAMPSAEQVASLGQLGDGPAQSNVLVGQVLAETLGTGGPDELRLDALLDSLGTSDGGPSALGSLASLRAGHATGAASPAWDAANALFATELIMTHPDAALAVA